MEYTARNYLVVYKFHYGSREYTISEIIQSRYLELNPDLFFYIKTEVKALVIAFNEDYIKTYNIQYLFDTNNIAILNIIPMNIFQTT